MSLPPPDRSHILTEQRNPRSANLHELSAAECVALIAAEDARVLVAVDAARPALVGFVTAVEPGFRRGGRLVYVGAGTSGRLGVLDASECPPTFCVPSERVVGIIAGGDGALRKSSEGKEDDPGGAHAELDALGLGPDDAVLGIAAGGTTPYVLGAVRHAAGLPGRSPGTGAPVTGLLTCTPLGPAGAEGIGHLIVLETGPEVVTGSTRMKAGSATKMALNIISTTLMVRSGKVYQNLMVDVKASNEKLRDRAARIITALTGVARDEAFVLLDRAGGQVKAAVVMHDLHLGADDAAAVLRESGGDLGRALAHRGV